MIRRLPIIPTLIVLAAVATMVGLGIWQLQRADWKASLLESYRVSQTMSADASWPGNAEEAERALYRHASITCDRVLSYSSIAGRSAAGQSGWAHVARCALGSGGQADVVLGWSNRPEEARWGGGEVSGIIAPGRDGEARLVASPPLAGLDANATPDPAELPNNHLSYAVQWFFFAGTALVIYLLALRKRQKGQGRA